VYGYGDRGILDFVTRTDGEETAPGYGIWVCGCVVVVGGVGEEAYPRTLRSESSRVAKDGDERWKGDAGEVY